MTAELAARSHYSFLEGSSSPRALAATAAALDIAAVGLCDRSGLYGAVEFTQAAQAVGVKPILGTELELVDGSRLRLLARDRTGYRQLCRAVSAAQLAGVKAQPRLRIQGLEPDHPQRLPGGRYLAPPERPRALRPTAGPFPQGWPGLPSTTLQAAGEPALIDPAELSGCIALAGGPHSTLVDALVRGDRRAALRHAHRLRECFGRDRAAILLTHHLHPADTWLAAECADVAERAGIATVASATPDHATTDDKPLLDVLTAIRHRTTLDQAAAHGLLLPNSEHRLQTEATLRERLRAHPQAFDTAARIAAECDVSLDFSDVRFPGFPVPDGETPFSVLYALCQESVQRRYHPMTRQVAARLQRELDVIEKTGLAEFFLITWDIMRFARENGIPGQGRGSAADSIVAYLLGITRVDPVAHDLLFERFLHEDHQGTPDIDIDFSTDHREQVLQYVYDKYGTDRTGMVANVVTFRPRIAIRQVGAAMGFPETIIDRLAKGADGWYMATLEETLRAGGVVDGEERVLPAAGTPPPSPLRDATGNRLAAQSASPRGVTPSSPSTTSPSDATPFLSSSSSLPWHLFLDVLQRIEGTPRHLSIHVGGMLVTGKPLVDVVPLERATMPGRVVVQFDKDDVEDLGLIKMDLLGLRTLSAIAECLDLIEQTTGVRPDLDALPLDDQRVYDMICNVDTIGLFQIESRAQQQSLWQSQPREFNDLIVQVAIIRPGPIQGDAVHPYLRRRQGLEPVTYQHPKLEPILAETRGVILYQEQILRIVMELAGYTAGEADRFRRAMNRHRSRLEMEALRDEFISRCVAHELTQPVSEQIFKSVAGFAQFGFCKSHAAAFARTAYETAWLRLEYPAHYTCALLNAQPMGFYAPGVLVDDARRHGVTVLPVDVTRSRARCTIEAVDNVVEEGRGTYPLAQTVLGELSSPAELAANMRPAPLNPRSSSAFAVRLGFAYVRALGPSARAACDDAVDAGANSSIEDFWRHTLLPRTAMENLVKVGAFDAVSGGLHRRQQLWHLKRIEESLPTRRRKDAVAEKTAQPKTQPSVGPPRGSGAVAGARFGDAPHVARDPADDPVPPLMELPAPLPTLPDMDERTRVTTEYALTQVSTGPHLVSFIRSQLDALGCLRLARARECADGTRVRVAGLVITRQAPMSASGFRFFTLTDEDANLDLVFRPDVAQRTRDAARHPLLMVDGLLQVEHGRINVVVQQVTALNRDGRPLPPDAPLTSIPAPRPHNFC